jgi:SAM-dependent methyltransferase
VKDASLSEEDLALVRQEVTKLYERVANDPGGEFDFHRGAEYAITLLGYDQSELAMLPESAKRSFVGVGNPHVIDPPRQGEAVLDVGSGTGMDLLLAARRVSPTGRAIGVDMTDAMLKQCQASISASGLANVEVRRGNAEALPVEDETIDVVISNGVLNLVPDKDRAFSEIYRVLRPGGRLMMGDTVVSEALSSGGVPKDPALWAICVGGALSEKHLIETVTRAGLRGARITARFECAKGTENEALAKLFEIGGVNLVAFKPAG